MWFKRKIVGPIYFLLLWCKELNRIELHRNRILKIIYDSNERQTHEWKKNAAEKLFHLVTLILDIWDFYIKSYANRMVNIRIFKSSFIVPKANRKCYTWISTRLLKLYYQQQQKLWKLICLSKNISIQLKEVSAGQELRTKPFYYLGKQKQISHIFIYPSSC